MKDEFSFLIVDDEVPVLIMLKRIISNAFPDTTVFTATNGVDGWQIVRDNHPSIVISDLSMPGLDGLELCKMIRERSDLNDVYFIIVTAHSEASRKIELLDSGADDFSSKPIVPEEFLAKLRSAFRIVKMQKKMRDENLILEQLKTELENYLQDMTRLSVKFLQARIPASFDMLDRVAKESYWIAVHLDEFDAEQLRNIEIAAFLSQAGRIFLPDNLLKTPVMTNGLPTDKLMYQVPVSAKEIVSGIDRLKDVGEIIYHIYENFDGTGIPDRLQAWQIPIGSRIIRAALDFEETILHSNKSHKQILESMLMQSKRLYDHRVVVLLDQYVTAVANENEYANFRAVQLAELVSGMALARDVITHSGLKLVPEGAVLSQKTIDRVIDHNTSDPILGNIYIKKTGAG